MFHKAQSTLKKIFTAPNGHSEKIQELDPLTGHRQLAQTSSADPASYCGLGSCQPRWARRLASTHVFMVVFLFAWVLQVNLFPVIQGDADYMWRFLVLLGNVFYIFC